MDIGALVNNQYQVIEHIGRGGMADVWSARDKRLRRMVAIKTIASNLGEDVDPVSLFEREAHTIAQMEHPHILPIYDFGEYDSSLYIVMRYVTGGSLEDIVREGPMLPDEVLRMGDAIARALDYAHENNVIHLDLKPPNILLDSSRSPYLADFGLATVLDPEGRARNPGSGTLLYMAPEQFVSEMIDHRADIYSFTIMLFHMLTGRLPFDGAAPLAMKQMQRGEEIPYIEDYVSSLPSHLTDLLRVGTSQDPDYRPTNHMELMEQFRAIIRPVAIDLSTTSFEGDRYEIASDPYNMLTEQDLDFSDSGLLEALDIYGRAVYDWQGGQGRFLLGVTHFMLMCEYYQNPEQYQLNIDENGYQMFLRGALEYDYELEYWWKRVDNNNRRWVCLHALRSGNAPARIRALYHLETLPDKEGQPVIPKLVAQTLEIETDGTAKKAALKVLATRARLIKNKRIDIVTEYRGRLLTTMTRLGIQIREPAFWQPYIYSPEIDQSIAEEAFDDDDDVAEYAARTVGQMRSLTGVQFIAEEQRNGRKGALDALAFIRDEAPALPNEVSRDARFYAWVTNTIRRLSDDPLEGILHFVLALIGGWIAMGDQIYTLFNSSQLLSATRWANALAMGLVFGLFVAITFYLTDEVSRRLQGFWPWWMRLGLTGALGSVMATLLFTSVRWLFYQDPDIAWDYMRFLGATLAFALVVTALLELRGWRGILLTTFVLFAPVYAGHRIVNAAIIGTDFTIVIFAPIALLLGILCGWRAAQLSIFESELPIGKILSFIFAILLGMMWAGGTWLYLENLLESHLIQAIAWDTVLLLVGIMIIFGGVASYWLSSVARISFTLTALITFALIYAWQGWQFFDYSYVMPLTAPSFEVVYYDGTALAPITVNPLIAYFPENMSQIFTVTLPMIFVVALGVNAQPLVYSWLDWIGKAKAGKERGGWLGITLAYTLFMTGMISVLSLFSAHVSVPWALMWSIWGAITFLFALATYQWTKWGARGLIASAFFLVFAGFFFDYVNMRYMASQGDWPAYLEVISISIPIVGITLTATQMYFWALWAAIIGVFAWGALRRVLWAGIGLVTMLVGWLLVALLSPLQGSVAVFAITNVALVAYSLAPKYELMETGRFQLPRLRALPPPPEATPMQKALTELHQFGKGGEYLATEPMTLAPPQTDEKVAPTQLFVDDADKAVAMPQQNMMTEFDPQSGAYEDEAPSAGQNMMTEYDAQLGAYEDDASSAEQSLRTEYDPQAIVYDVNIGSEDDTTKYEVDTVAYETPDTNIINSRVNPSGMLDDLDTEPKARTGQAAKMLDDIDTEPKLRPVDTSKTSDDLDTEPKARTGQEPKPPDDVNTQPKIRFDKADLHGQNTVRYDRPQSNKDEDDEDDDK